MSRFRPTRASSPIKPSHIRSDGALTHVSDLSRSSATSAPELAGLSQEDVDFIDAVIQRATPTATTFLTVFKAYNDILQDRGLDPQHEVLLYSKLLKLGTLKGQNWGEKWRMVKLQHGYEVPSAGRARGNINPIKKPAVLATQLSSGSKANKRAYGDTFTLHSHQDDTESNTEEETASSAGVPQYHLSRPLTRGDPSPSPSPSTFTAANSLGLDLGTPSSSPSLETDFKFRGAQAVRRHPAAWDAGLSETTVDIAPSISTTPPSYGAAVYAQKQRQSLLAGASSTRPRSPPAVRQPAPPQRIIPQRRENVLNENEAWNKIKIQRDEAEADRFREDRLIERCWDIWRQGYQWILTTNDQIAQARDNLILRLAIHRWRHLLASRRELFNRVTGLSNNRCLKAAVNVWKAKLKDKKRDEWRQDMRTKMKNIREKREIKLKKDAWAKWRQSYRSHLSDQHYTERLVLRLFNRWRTKLLEVDHLEAAADQYSSVRAGTELTTVWNRWRHASDLRIAERTIVERVGLRVMGDVINVWKRQMHDYHTAQAFYDKVVMKTVLRSWKTARDRIRALERRAVKHVARQDDILVRAVLRVWKAHERGKLLDRVRTVRTLKQTWAAWEKRMRNLKERENIALAFSNRSSSFTSLSALQTWRQVYRTHQNSHSFAIQYHSAQLSFKMLHIWRVQLRVKLKMIKQAKIAEKFFLMRRTWRHWTDRLDARRREKKLKLLEQRMVLVYFDKWIQRTREQQHRKLAEQYIQDFVAKRIMRNALSRWTNRVIDLKLREIEVSQKHDRRLLTASFKKWKALCVRHAEELSLMESYQDVKREETIRRMFHKWLSAARSTRHKRVVLQEKEAEMRHASVSVAWDRWRDRFKDEKLRPIEIDVLLQTQRNLLFRAFGIWHSKTRSLPAIRFHASHLKAKVWERWRDAMPRALQAKEAREMAKKAALSKFMERWVQRYRSKIALKAIARARYLRLPTSAPRPPQTPSSAVPSSTRTTPAYPRRFLGPEAGPSRPPSFAVSSSTQPRIGAITNLLTSTKSNPNPNPRQGDARNRPRLFARDLSPAPSRSSYGATHERMETNTDPTGISRPSSEAGGGEVRRSRLWAELKEVQRKSRSRGSTGSWDPP